MRTKRDESRARGHRGHRENVDHQIVPGHSVGGAVFDADGFPTSHTGTVNGRAYVSDGQDVVMSGDHVLGLMVRT